MRRCFFFFTHVGGLEEISWMDFRNVEKEESTREEKGKGEVFG